MTKMMNTPIEQLIKQYEEEECNFDNIEWVKKLARLYVLRMEDSQVRCILHALVEHIDNMNVDVQLQQRLSKLMADMESLPPEMINLIDDNYWDLL